MPVGKVSRMQMLAHVSQEGRPVEIDQETWGDFLDVRPPSWMAGSQFASAEGIDCIRLFWEDHRRYFARQLTESETERFFQLSGVNHTE